MEYSLITRRSDPPAAILLHVVIGIDPGSVHHRAMSRVLTRPLTNHEVLKVPDALGRGLTRDFNLGRMRVVHRLDFDRPQTFLQKFEDRIATFVGVLAAVVDALGIRSEDARKKVPILGIDAALVAAFELLDVLDLAQLLQSIHLMMIPLVEILSPRFTQVSEESQHR